MTLDSWLHFLHVVAAIVWVGGGFMLVMVGLRIRSTANPQAMAELGRTIPYVGIRVLGPAWIVLLITGVWMVLSSASWRFTQFWVLLGIGLFAVAFLVGAIFMSQAGVRLERAAREADSHKANLSSLFQRWLLGYSVILAVLLVAVWDMVFKPGV
jgi:uncharacterized membrane protein